VRWEGEYIKDSDDGGCSVVILPEYYKLIKKDENDIGMWVAVAPEEVPEETGLHGVNFKNTEPRNTMPYVTPEDDESCWKTPGPAAGPFKVTLGDGSTVTYSWYRFADQPALLNADLSKEEREELQRRVEMIHRNWTKDREYLPPPLTGKLAEIDPALLVIPPKGLEIGYVPIVTSQGLE
jgi:hypothetical protein